MAKTEKNTKTIQPPDTRPEVTLEKLLLAEKNLEALVNVLEQAGTQYVKASFRVGRAIEVRAAELKPFYEKRLKLAISMDVLNKKNEFDEKSEQFSEFASVIEDLLSEPVNCTIRKIPLSWLENLPLFPTMFIHLGWLIEDDMED